MKHERPNPLYAEYGRWSFECRAKSEMQVNARDEFKSCRDKLRANGWIIKEEDEHECVDDSSGRKKTLHKIIFHCFRADPEAPPPVRYTGPDRMCLAANEGRHDD